MNPNDNNPYQTPEYQQNNPQAPPNQESPFPPQQQSSQPVTPQPYYPPQNPVEQNSVSQTGMFQGRLNRIGCLMVFVYALIYGAILLGVVIVIRGNPVANIIDTLLALFFVILIIPVTFSTGIRRWHDLDQSGWLVLLSFVPLVNIVVAIIHFFVPGTKGNNKYGPVDDRPSTVKKVIFGK